MIPARITAVLLVVPVFGRSGVTVVVVVSGAGVTVLRLLFRLSLRLLLNLL